MESSRTLLAPSKLRAAFDELIEYNEPITEASVLNILNLAVPAKPYRTREKTLYLKFIDIVTHSDQVGPKFQSWVTPER